MAPQQSWMQQRITNVTSILRKAGNKAIDFAWNATTVILIAVYPLAVSILDEREVAPYR